jgi:hypothetical protein
MLKFRERPRNQSQEIPFPVAFSFFPGHFVLLKTEVVCSYNEMDRCQTNQRLHVCVCARDIERDILGEIDKWF